MNIKILFFAQLREVFGAAEHVIDVNNGLTAGELAQRLLRRPGGLLAMTHILYAVNENFVSPDEKLRHGDTLALMTPVAGG